MLPPADFKAVVRNTPLLAIDLIVRSLERTILLGLRKNPPARGFWFVPGGRVFKNDSSEQAIRRISREELGLELGAADMTLKGVYDHIYDDNVFNDLSFNTHYVVLAAEMTIDARMLVLPDAQHDSYRFVVAEDIIHDPEVHPFTKSYFSDVASNIWKFQH